MNITKTSRTPICAFLIIISFLISLNISAQNSKKQSTSGFLDFNTYYDTREFHVMTINILSKLPNRLQYFSLTNYQGSDKSLDFSNFYSEQNLRWQIKEMSPFDLSLQYVMRQGASNDDFRLGVRWRISDTPKLNTFFKKLNMSYSINPMLIQFRVNAHTKSMTQIEHVYKINLYKDIIYLGGFADQNFIYANNKVAFKWVSEHQLGIRMIDQLYAVAEYRINDFLTSDNTGLGIGIEYKIIF